MIAKNTPDSQQTTEFGDRRYIHPNSVTDFLDQWKA